MPKLTILLVVLAAFAPLAAAQQTREALVEMGREPQPPAMPQREIRPPATQPAGARIDIVDGDCKTLLFVPVGYALPADGRVNLTVHFHGAEWFVIDEHIRCGVAEPLLVVNLGQGSSVYGRAFDDPLRLRRLAGLVETRLGSNARVAQLDLTSFSAGYGAVREILKHDMYIARTRRVILCDSLYAGWDPATTQPGATSRPSSDNMWPFERFLRLAAGGEKTFVLAHSSVPTPYANTVATAKWVAELVDAPRTDVPRNSTPASSDKDFPLLYRADLGRLHLWGYGGEDARAHLTSVRHLADIWRALDACGDR